MWNFKVDEVENYAYVDGVFSIEDCKNIVKTLEPLEKEIAKTGASKTAKPDKKVRDSSISWVRPDNNEELFRKLAGVCMAANEKFFNFDLSGFGEPLQYTRYEAPGGKYVPHIDRSFKGPVRKLSFSLVLSDPKTYTGGGLSLQFGAKKDNMEQPQGRIIFFPSYVLHGVSPVKKGSRRSLVGWITGPQFK
tara:strand:+ start:939 stop:1511 length:573 start_codon:yes stop_codon:yes gene_type:complete